MRNIRSVLFFAIGMSVGFLCLHHHAYWLTGLIRSSSLLPVDWRAHRPIMQHNHTDGPGPTSGAAAAAAAAKIRILCWVMTGPKNLETRTRHVRDTWARHCDKVLFMSSAWTDFPTVGLDVKEGRDQLYWKTVRAFQYVHRHHLDAADWFLKADDDTFVVVENLRWVLSRHDPEKPLYAGHRFAPFVAQGYMSGGAGYVLSKEALRRFVAAFENGMCTHNSDIEDMALGMCMEKVKVLPVDTRDRLGRHTFHHMQPEMFVVRQHARGRRPWYLQYEHYPMIEGPGCCSDLAVSFHYITPVAMHILDYFTHHLRPFGYKYRYDPDQPAQETMAPATTHTAGGSHPS